VGAKVLFYFYTTEVLISQLRTFIKNSVVLGMVAFYNHLNYSHLYLNPQK